MMITAPPRRPRDGLNDHMIRLVWNAATELGFPDGVFVKLLLLEPARVHEEARRAWSQMDLEQDIWECPSAKEGPRGKRTSWRAPIMPRVMRLLTAHWPQERRTGLLFPDLAADPSSGYRKVKTRLDRAIERIGRCEAKLTNACWQPTPRFGFYDLRLTVARHLYVLGAASPMIRATLHLAADRGGIPWLTPASDLRMQRQALTLWHDHLQGILASPGPAPQGGIAG